MSDSGLSIWASAKAMYAPRSLLSACFGPCASFKGHAERREFAPPSIAFFFEIAFLQTSRERIFCVGQACERPRALGRRYCARWQHVYSFNLVLAWTSHVHVHANLWNGAPCALGYTASLAGRTANYSQRGLRRWAFLFLWRLRVKSGGIVVCSTSFWHYG